MAALSLEEAIESVLESFPNIDCLKDEQKKCIAALLQIACSKRSDSGERCEVKIAMKSRGGLGREVRERL